jgi:hypothetical protein
MAKKTRKLSKTKISTIPELKRSFDRLDAETQKILAAPGSPLEKVKRFQKVWMNIFHKTVTKDAAEAYLAIKKKTRGRATRKQRGGMAPLDYSLRPGIDGPYGTYPAYVQSGIGYPMPGILEGCGVTNSGPQLSASLGTNQVGGQAQASLMDVAHAFAMRPIAPSIPPSVFQDIQSSYMGQPLGASSDPVTNKPPYL